MRSWIRDVQDLNQPKDEGFSVEVDREVDGRWIAEVPSLPGVFAYDEDKAEAIARAVDLARNVVAESILDIQSDLVDDIEPRLYILEDQVTELRKNYRKLWWRMGLLILAFWAWTPFCSYIAFLLGE